MEYLSFLLGFLVFTDVLCEICRETSLTSQSRSFECPNGCCGEIYSRFCCKSSNTFSIEAIIIGLSVAAVLFVVIVIVIVIYMCKKKKRVLIVPDCNSTTLSSMKMTDTTDTTLAPEALPPEYDSVPPSAPDPNTGVAGPVRPGYPTQDEMQYQYTSFTKLN